jgi:hypothetical protein
LSFTDRFLKNKIAGSSVGATLDLRANSGNASYTDRAVVNRIRDINHPCLKMRRERLQSTRS